MKTTLSLKTLAFFMFASLLLSAPGCTSDKDGDDDDPDPKTLCELLEGDWEVTSYLVDGDEIIGDIFTSLDMEFEDDDCEGDLTLTASDGTNTADIPGEYSLDEDDEEITLVINGSSYTYDIEIDGDEMEISGTNDGTTEVFKAERQ